MPATTLFEPNHYTHQACPVPGCQAIRTAGQTGQIVTCSHDLERDGRRPAGCLNRVDNAHTPWPEGY